eukprot:m.253789 g.253789  ORF g.253789 m.253789 type:complete len:67 (-) comp17396_c0_seq1:528-728(-)
MGSKHGIVPDGSVICRGLDAYVCLLQVQRNDKRDAYFLAFLGFFLLFSIKQKKEQLQSVCVLVFFL